MPVHTDFHSMLDAMTGQYCDGETDDTKKDQDVEGYANKTCKKALSVFYATCKEKGLDYTEPMPKEKVREHVSAILPFQILEKIVDKPLRIRGLAITAGMSRNFNIYTPEELQAFASKLVAAPMYIEHVAVPNAVGKVTKTEWDGGNLWYEAEIYDDEVAAQIRKGLIQHVSVGADYETLDIVDGQVPHGLHNAELSLVAVPGIPETNVQVLEKLRAQKRVKEQDECCVFCGEPAEIWVACCFDCFKKLPLSESKKKELLEHQRKMREQQAEPIIAGEYVLGFYQDVALFLPEHFRTVWLDKENGILAVFGKLRVEPETERVQSIFFAKEKMWDQTKIQDWLSLHPDHMAPAGDSAIGKAPLIERGNMKKKPKVKEQNEGEPKTDKERFMAHFSIDEEAFQKLYDILGDELFKLLPERGTKVSEQNGDQEKGEHGCIIGKERWDEEQEKCVPITAEARVVFLEASNRLKEQDAELTVDEIKQKIVDLTTQRDEVWKQMEEIGEEEKAELDQKIAVIYAEIQAYEQALAQLIAGQVKPATQEQVTSDLENKVSELLTRVAKLEKAQGQGNLAESLLKKSNEPSIKVTEAIEILEGLLPSPMVERSSMGMQRECQAIRGAILRLKEMLKNG